MTSAGDRTRVAAIGAALSLTALVAVLAFMPATASASTRSEVRNAFVRLTKETSRLPARNARAERALLKIARRARRVSLRRPCRARALMRLYKRRLKRVRRRAPPSRPAQNRTRAVSTRGMLEAAAVAVDATLLSHPRSRRCGGARRSPSSTVVASLLNSDENGLTMRIRLPQAHFASRRLGGRDWSQMAIDGLSQGLSEGKPGVPMLLEQFGVPTGANVSLRVSNVSSYTLRAVNLLPEQPQPVDQEGQKPEELFYDKPFEIDRGAYRSRAPFPARVADASAIGEMRDVRIGGAELAGGQYRPRRRSLRVITGMDVRVTFGGNNTGRFADARLNDPFNATFNRLYESALINWDTITRRPDGVIYPFCGEEVLIVTSAALRPAANTLRTQKVAEGFVTRIVETGSGPGQIGTTNTQIQSFIRGRLSEACWIRPSYVILIGDTANVPTFHVPCGPGGDAAECDIASDLPYSLRDDADYFADTALGRIPAPDLATANTVVNKIVGYETTLPAPPGDDFFSHMTVTSFFEHSHHCVLNEGQSGTPNCDPEHPPVTGHWEIDPAQRRDARTFTQVAEQVRGAMVSNGYTVDRLYHASPLVTPEEFWDGTPMPSAIRKPGFAWDADTDDWITAFNDGRNIVFHRDHGSPHVWWDPTLSTGNLGSLTNGTQLPVAFGINCSSTRFDVPGDPSLGEGLLQDPDGGAVGVFGDSRVSGSWPNSSLARGFFDALFPNLRPAYGSPDPIRRMGDVLVAGKQYLHTEDPGADYGHGHLYGYFGDPTMQLWIAPPQVFDPKQIEADVRFTEPPFPKPPGPGPDPPPWWVEVQLAQPAVEGTLVTLEEGQGEPIGRGVVQNGRAVIFPLRNAQTGGLRIELQQEGYFAGQELVDDPS